MSDIEVFDCEQDVLDRFMRHCTTVSPIGCWLWDTAPPKRRYASFWMDRKREQAHRASWLLCCGPIPEGLHVLHKCDVPLCVNPDHLFLGTHDDNMADMKEKGRASAPTGDEHWTRLHPESVARGPRNGMHGVKRVGDESTHHHLMEADVRQIKARIAQGESDAVIANAFGVRRGAIWFIRSGRNWGHVI
jgi:hypothetical protein